jgi:hypothetical protein
MSNLQRAVDALAFLVAMGQDFAASLYTVSERFGVNPNELAYEFDAVNDNQWRSP